MEPVPLYSNGEVIAFLPDKDGEVVFSIYLVSGILKLTERSILEEDFCFRNYLAHNPFRVVPYEGQLVRLGHHIYWIQVRAGISYLIYRLCDLNGEEPRYFLETVQGRVYTVQMFDSGKEAEVYAATF